MFSILLITFSLGDRIRSARGVSYTTLFYLPIESLSSVVPAMSLLGVSESRYIETDNEEEVSSECSFISYPLVFLFSRVQVRVGFFTMIIIPVAHIRAHPVR